MGFTLLSNLTIIGGTHYEIIGFNGLVNEYPKEALTNELKGIEDRLSKAKMELANLSFDNIPDKELKDLNRDDETIFISDNKPHKGNVSRVLIDRDFP